MRVRLQRSTSQRKSLLHMVKIHQEIPINSKTMARNTVILYYIYLLYMVLARAATELRQLSAFWPLYTHSVPTLILGRMKLP